MRECVKTFMLIISLVWFSIFAVVGGHLIAKIVSPVLFLAVALIALSVSTIVGLVLLWVTR